MPEPFENPEPQQAPPSSSPFVLFLGALVVIALLVGAWSLFTSNSQSSTSPARNAALSPMTPAERAYIPSIAVDGIALSRAENFLRQQVTILNAQVTNHGSQPVLVLYLQVQFDDSLGQIALRESRPVLGSPTVPLAPGQSRTIEISFDHVPASWNMQQPTVRVANLQLVPPK
jgi:hypothetical protein